MEKIRLIKKLNRIYWCNRISRIFEENYSIPRSDKTNNWRYI